MEELGFNLVGYGCVTCIGNSGPLPVEISKAVNENDLAVTAVLSGNRNFEGRISPDVKMNYLGFSSFSCCICANWHHES
jgi:aconitate hydratase